MLEAGKAALRLVLQLGNSGCTADTVGTARIEFVLGRVAAEGRLLLYT